MKTACSFRKKLLSASVASVLGLSASIPLHADTYTLDFTGAFTMLNSTGGPVPNNGSPYTYSGTYKGWFGNRTPISGSIDYDTVAGTGTLTINGFYFFGSSPTTSKIALAHGAAGATDPVSFHSIGDGFGGSGNLLLANALFRWNTLNDADTEKQYPVPIVLDATGLLAALTTANTGTVIVNTGVLPASDGTNFGNVKKPALLPLGPTPIATTSWNTTVNGNSSLTLTSTNCGLDSNDLDINGNPKFSCAGVIPSGILPLISDTIGSSPIVGTSFDGFNPNFDFMKLTVRCKNGICANVAPTIVAKAPSAGAPNVDVGTTVTISFSEPMQAATVATAISLDRAGTPIPGTTSPSTGNATIFTFTPTSALDYSTTYTVTVSSAATDVNDNLGLSGAPVTWNFTTGVPVVGPSCANISSQVPVGSNFTMLTGQGKLDNGTNDVTYSFDLVNLNTAVSGANSMNFNNTLSSPTPYYGHLWTAHHIRLFAPGGPYVINTECTTAQLDNGTCTPNPVSSKNITFSVGANQIGGHMLFDWNKASNIDVVNVWDKNAAWNINPTNKVPPPPASTNLLNTDKGTWGGPSGVSVNPRTIWQLVSTDPDSDGINGVAMIDGAFVGFNANFNLGASDSCLAAPPTPISVGTPSSSHGCSISKNPSTILERSDWLLVSGFLAWLGALRKRFKRQTQS